MSLEVAKASVDPGWDLKVHGLPNCLEVEFGLTFFLFLARKKNFNVKVLFKSLMVVG